MEIPDYTRMSAEKIEYKDVEKKYNALYKCLSKKPV